MAKYEELVEGIQRQIKSGIWNPGDKLPSLRKQVEHTGLSLMTVLHAYQVLESQGWLIARPRSGYCVAPTVKKNQSQVTQAAISWTEKVDINAFIFEILQASKKPQMINLGFSYPDPALYPRQQVNRALTSAARNMPITSSFDNLPPGNEALRILIAKRYAAKGVNISPDEIVITAGALEALNLSLQACTRAGDWVVVESPTFYGTLQSLERLGLKALSIRTDPYSGIDLDSLERAFQTHDVKACWFMSNHQNPLGFTMSLEKKKQVSEILQRYNIPLIEDDVYGELYVGNESVSPIRAFDESGNTMLCSSFSKSLIAGLRIGWVAAGNRAIQIQKLQLMSTLATSAPIQLTLKNYLSGRHYEMHLKNLRKHLQKRKMEMVAAFKHYLHQNVKIVNQPGGYFIWLEMPKHVDALNVYHAALSENISIAPGKMFSLTEQYNHCIRLNASFELNETRMRAIKKLSQIINNFCR
ncbi:PLP-dependent aminotransferase family protein [Vibrio cincinnatiensis]|uniref:aminotransferase-like domain-containing protein n=1 Tax=Vibrio cincinnatiensis TaxID=675 RepID=UPI001EE08FD1|nr:PLP-dependent aminotransferase family protein [Vibrio cincinnatiensis]MCG3729884.1 PLP-dependent aminotransferase family protein [Vibrio cincinnatiensis]